MGCGGEFGLICLHPMISQQFFSHVGAGLPKINQFLATGYYVFYSRTQYSDSTGGEVQTSNTGLFIVKIVNIVLPVNLNICFGCSKEPSH